MSHHDDQPTVPVKPQMQGEMDARWHGRPQKTQILHPQQQPVYAWLVIVDGPYAGQILRLNPEVTVIGRDAGTCDHVLDDAAVSVQHCKIKAETPDEESEGERKREKRFFIYDLATTNGTKVNGEKILRHCLRDGDRIEVGHTTLVFKEI